MTSIAQTIRQKLEDLQSADFRDGFEDTVLHRVCQAVGENHYWDLWSDAAVISHLSPSRKEKLISVWFDDDESILDLWLDVEEQASGKGSFQMPSWGTYGT